MFRFKHLLAAWLLLTVLSVQAEDFQLTPLFKSGDSIAGSSAKFEEFGGPWVSISDQLLAFRAKTSEGPAVFQVRKGQLRLLLDRTVKVDGAQNFYRSGTEPRVHGEDVVARVTGSEGKGIYLMNPAGVTEIASLDLQVPGSTQAVSQYLGVPAVSSQGVAFMAELHDSSRVILWKPFDGEVQLVAAHGMMLGGSTVDQLGDGIDVFGHAIVFYGRTEAGDVGIYRWESGNIATIVDSKSAIPDAQTGELFKGIGSRFTYDRRGVMFHGSSLKGIGGIYLARPGKIVKIADEADSFPGRAEPLQGFDLPGVSSLGFVFRGIDKDFKGIYFRASESAPIQKVVATGDMIQGKQVTMARLGTGDTISGQGIALVLTFADGSSGVYLAHENHSWAILGQPAKPNPATPPASAVATYASIPAEQVETFIEEILLGWERETRSRRPKGQLQVLFHDDVGQQQDPFFAAVKDVNAAFGYDKLVPQITAKTSLDEGHVLVYLGDYRDARKVLRDSGGSGGSFSEPWTGWFWWDEKDDISKAVTVFARERLTKESFPYELRRALLTALGYPGYTTEFPGSIFGTPPNPKSPDQLAFSDLDRVILRFCDTHLATDSSPADLRRVIRDEWPEFAKQADAAKASQ